MNKHDGLSKHAYDNDVYEHAKTCHSEVCEPFHKRGHLQQTLSKTWEKPSHQKLTCTLV